MKYIYTAVFSMLPNDSTVYARVPDIPGCITTGHDLQDAITQITDAAHGCLVVLEDEGLNIPSPTSQSDIPLSDDVIAVSLIQLDTLKYRAATDSRCVRKNVSLPAWMSNMADRMDINCSKLLQDALLVRFQ